VCAEHSKLHHPATQPHAANASGGALVVIARLPAITLAGLIQFYRRYVSPYSIPSCRFTPTCSRYAVDAVRRYGAIRGGWLAAWRVLRCNPFNKGGYDPLL